MDKLDEWDKKLKESQQRDKEKRKNEPKFKDKWNSEMNKKEEEVREKQRIEKEKEPQTEREKLAKTGNFVAKGVALWLLIPFFMIVAVIGVFLVFGIIDWLGF